MSIYKDCDIRGIYGKELTAKDAYLVGRALPALFTGRFVLGGDCRVSTPELKAELLRGLTESGAQVTDIGTIPTPALYFALKHLNAAAGATVTASHNPSEYNGIKFMIGDKPVTRETIDRVKAIVESGEFPCGQGSVEKLDIMGDYLASMECFKTAKPLKVLADAGNGAMSLHAPKALMSAGCDVTPLFCEPDGSFPNRDPNPSDFTHLDKTRAAVLAAHADFGVAFDGDGDRAVFIDETGTPVPNEKILVLFIRALLKDAPTPVVYDQKSSSVIRKAIEAMGGTAMPERSGHAFIKRRFLENGAAVAGEVSGHFFFGALGYDDGLYAALTLAKLLSESDETLSDMTSGIVCPPITPDIRFFCPYAEQQSRLDACEAMAREAGAKISHLDGVRADFDNCWFLVRKSVTAEQITLRAEAETKEDLRKLLDRVAQVLPQCDRDVLAKLSL